MFETIFIIRIILLLVAVALAAYTDYKTGYIYDWISLPLIAIGLIINIFTYPFKTLIPIILIAVGIYLFGYFAYYFGKIGGGDIKLFIGIHLILPYLNNQLFIFWVIIVSSLLSVMFVSISYAIKLNKKIKINKRLLKKKKSKIFKSMILFLVFLVFVIFATSTGDMPTIVYITIPPMFFGSIIIIFEDEIKRHIYLKQKPISKLEEGDVFASEFAKKELITKLKLGKRTVLEKEDISRAKSLKLKALPIFDNLPRFGIYILFGVLCVLIFRNWTF
ncbi:MAG TPA: A24 family peptidase [Candidatus Diapherotrites archaeon]|nr:A24 family peptidase [Candidatus Diapherotrites archaeon]